MNIHSLYSRVSPLFRRRRMRGFWRDFGITSQTLVLDVGGTLFNWSLIPERPRLVMVNVELPEERDPGVHYVVADGRQIPFRDKAFQIVFSNSVIEHVGAWDDQRRFADEVARVGCSYFVQTPNRWFPIEPHLIAPLIHWLPKSWLHRLWFLSVRGWISRQSYTRFVEEVRLLSENDMKILFPHAEILGERVLGIRKSWLGVHCQRRRAHR